MTGSPILDECQTLFEELERVESLLSRMTGDLVDSAADQDENETSRIEGLIEGLIDSHSEVEEEFAALRAKIVELGRQYHLCPQEVPDEGYSPGRLRGVLESLQRMERGFKQPPPESLESLWEHIPSDMLASLENSAQQAAEEVDEGPSATERLPSDIEIFLDRVISEARDSGMGETKLPSGTVPSEGTASILRTSAPKRQSSVAPRPEPTRAAGDSVQGQNTTKRSKASGRAKKTCAAPVVSSPSVAVEAPLPPSVPTSLPSEVLKVAAAAEQKARQAAAEEEAQPEAEQEARQEAAASEEKVPQEAATEESSPQPAQPPPPASTNTDWKPSSVASDRDYRELLEYGEGKLGLGRSEFADLLANLALLNHKQGRYDDSEELHRKELMIRENELGQDHPKVATSLNNLALLFRDLGRHQEARALWERSLAIVEKAFGPEHPKVALRLSNLADLLNACGETAQAEQYYQRLLTLRETGSGRRRREAKSSLRKYVDLLRSTRRRREARKVEAEIITSRPGWLPKWR